MRQLFFPSVGDVSVLSSFCFESFLLLVARMLLVVRPGAPSSVLAPSSTLSKAGAPSSV